MKQLSEQARKMRNAYAREYRQKNPEKIKEYSRRHWEKKAASYTVAMRAKELQAQGYTQRQIAEQLNISLGAVNKYLNKE